MEPMLLGPDQGEAVTATDRRDVRILAGLEELAVTYSRYAAGESGPPPHVHREHADCWWVIGGVLTFELDGDPAFEVSAGTFVAAPAGLVHTFRNEGPGDATFLNLHAPSCGFHDYLRARRDGDEAAEARFDTYDPPDDGGAPSSEAVVVSTGGGEEVRMGASSATIKVGGGQAGGNLSLAEVVLAAGFPGPVPHRHRAMVDSFYVLEGSLGVRLGEAERQAEPGSYALVPPGNPHTFFNPAESPVRLLNVMAPGGFERYLKEVAEAVPPGAAPDPALMAEIASKYDFEPAP